MELEWDKQQQQQQQAEKAPLVDNDSASGSSLDASLYLDQLKALPANPLRKTVLMGVGFFFIFSAFQTTSFFQVCVYVYM